MLKNRSINRPTKDKQRIEQRFAQAILSYDQAAVAQQQINQQLLQLLQTYINQDAFESVLEVGCGTGQLSELLANNLNINQWTINDLNEQAITQTKVRLANQNNVTYIQGDAEFLFTQKAFQSPHLDIIVSASTVQWFENPEHFIRLAEQALMSDGILLFSTFLPQNLLEIKQLTEIGLDYPSIQQWQEWLQPHFEILAWQTPVIKLTFDHPIDVLQHLKQTGVTGIQSKPWSKGRLREFCQRYQQLFTHDGQVTLTYTPLLVLASKR